MSTSSISISTMPLVLLIEDEVPMRKFLRVFLSGAGYRVEDAANGEAALKTAVETPPDLVILDLGLPDMDGQDVLRKLREWLKAPIIVLSVRYQDAQKIMALNHGADDYLTKPFSTGELLARIRVALRHVQGQSGADLPIFESGDLKIDLSTRRVFVRDSEVKLTRLEYKLLTAMVRQAGKVLTHQYLLEQVWGPKHVENTQYLRVFMAGLRRKVEFDPAQPLHLLTEQGVGYRLAID
jgi:two-component system, OmpR family, KDP operon response regulator KdpE